MAYAIDSYERMFGLKPGRSFIPPIIDPNDPEQVKKLRKQVEESSGGMSSIKTVNEMKGSGIRPEGIDPMGYGYTVVDTEKARERYNPNSEVFKNAQIESKKQALREEAARKGRYYNF